MTDKKTTRELVLILLERSESHLRELQDQNKHLAQINGSVSDLKQTGTALTTTVYGRKSDKGLCGEVSNLKKILWGVLVILVSGGGVLGAEAQGIINLFG